MSSLDFLNKQKASEEPQKPAEPPKIEVKKDVSEHPKAEKKKDPEQPEKKNVQNIMIHSELDAMIVDRVKSQPKSLEEVDSEVIVKPKDGRHALSLPEEIEKYTGKYAFCWIFKRKQAIDEACDMLHYKLTNHTYFPDLPDHIFSARGVIERGDNVLAFRPRKIDDEMRKVPGLESIDRIRSRQGAHENDPNFYVPKPESKEEGRVVGV